MQTNRQTAHTFRNGKHVRSFVPLPIMEKITEVWLANNSQFLKTVSLKFPLSTFCEVVQECPISVFVLFQNALFQSLCCSKMLCFNLCARPKRSVSVFVLFQNVLFQSLHCTKTFCFSLCVVPKRSASVFALFQNVLFWYVCCSKTFLVFVLFQNTLFQSVRCSNTSCFSLCAVPQHSVSVFVLFRNTLFQSLCCSKTLNVSV